MTEPVWTEVRCPCGRWIAETTGSIRTVCQACGAEIRLVKKEDREGLTKAILPTRISVRT